MITSKGRSHLMLGRLLIALILVMLCACISVFSVHAQEIPEQIDKRDLSQYQYLSGDNFCYEYAWTTCEYLSYFGVDCEQVAYAYKAGGKIKAHMIARFQYRGEWCITSNNVLTCGKWPDLLRRDIARKGGELCNYEIRPGDNSDPYIVEWCEK